LQGVGILLNEIGVVDATSADEQKGATRVVTNIMTMVGITITVVFSI
jgi:hypothetical protein